ncbi:sensor histidine kinase [Pelomonas sp. CA6]|uniref:sensor histidine kinase n=1 Tax=Pelomonas sp. CA6 TaxID=2907999 RepID=UPI001F4BF20E|nr:sensor histidine kinase [Pelomonas sp. CA6]MCH7343206.1 sensor histidine kinase [Pelomonas sp. CA6]
MSSTERSPGRPAPSLRWRLLAWLIAPVLLTAPLLGYGLYRAMLEAGVGWLDQSLGDTALALASLVRERDGQLLVELSSETDRALRFDRQDRVYFLVLDPRGHVLYGDPQLLALRGKLQRPLTRGRLRFADAHQEGQALRVAALEAACGAQQSCAVMVAETLHKRDALKDQLLLAMGLVGASLIGLLVLGGALAIGQGLQPLARLGAEIERRDLDRLDPLQGPVATELRPLIAAFNRLFERLRHAAAAQQEFLANAAHQLRTPLTSLRTEIDLALLEPHDAQVEPLLRRLQTSVDRSARLAQQMLSIARAESEPLEQPRPVDLREIAAQVAEDWVPRALDGDLDLGFELAPAPAVGQAFLLRELLENLLHNSLSYAGAGARVTVRSRCEGGEALLEVEDNGPGIAPAERERVLQRFQRGAQTQGSGSGLGLAIARDIAQRHGGVLELLDPLQGQGLRVRLRMPRAPG